MSRASDHRANVHGASVGNGGLTDQMAPRRRKDGTVAGGEAINGTSIFDPVLAELLYRWFSAEGMQVIDPFAGGSVRGIVAAKLGRRYFGCDLRPEQIAENREQAVTILDEEEDGQIEWVSGDSEAVMADEGIGPQECDMILTCPPYADLEIYSRDPADISNMPFGKFMSKFKEIMLLTCSRLKDHRFCCIVIGDARDKKTTHYYGVVAHTIVMMQSLGLGFYNEMQLVTPAGTLPARARNGMEKGRKVGRSHQTVLVFVKGDWREAVKAMGPCEFGLGDPFSAETGDPLAGLGIPL